MSALDDLISSQFLNSDPTAAYFNAYGNTIGAKGAGGKGNFNYAQFLRGNAGNYYDMYRAGLPSDPTQKYTDFLKQQDPQAQFQALSPYQRGENSSQYAPRVRYAG